MPKTFMFVLSLKNGAMAMALINFAFAIATFIGCGLYVYHASEDTKLYLICGIVLGVFNVFTGGTLVVAIVKGEEKLVLIYVLLEFMNLFILTIFSGINMFEFDAVTAIFICCFILWYGLYCIYSFYLELAEYNSVSSGVIEITSKNVGTGLGEALNLPERAMDNTPV